MTSGGQCVMTSGIPLMLLWCASSWDMHSPDVCLLFDVYPYVTCSSDCVLFSS